MNDINIIDAISSKAPQATTFTRTEVNDVLDSKEPAFTLIPPLQELTNMPSGTFSIGFDTMLLNPFHCAGAVDSDGTIMTSSGRYSYTVVKIANGQWEILFDVEHLTTTPIVTLGMCVPASRLYMTDMCSSTGFKVYHRDYQFNICNSPWNFTVIA